MDSKTERLARHTKAMMEASAPVSELTVVGSTQRTLREWLAVLGTMVPNSRSTDCALEGVGVYKANGFAPFDLDRVCTFATFAAELYDCSVRYSSRSYLVTTFQASDGGTSASPSAAAATTPVASSPAAASDVALRYTLQVRQLLAATSPVAVSGAALRHALQVRQLPK